MQARLVTAVLMPVRGEGTWDYRPDLETLPNQRDPEVAHRFLEGEGKSRVDRI